ncbi:Uncharacterised protein [Mycobacteroides abscessus subsp. abscessus]|nr:Uncharacterised protein [Mycobacteroides abscessus subsp. abscessus]
MASRPEAACCCMGRRDAARPSWPVRWPVNWAPISIPSVSRMSCIRSLARANNGCMRSLRSHGAMRRVCCSSTNWTLWGIAVRSCREVRGCGRW